jgi:hypothetical protein
VGQKIREFVQAEQDRRNRKDGPQQQEGLAVRRELLRRNGEGW